MTNDRSAALFARAQAVIPGGVNSPVRAFRSVGGTPRFASRGAGAILTDVDGNDYIDFVQSWGPLPLGHAHPAVMDAAASALASGSTFGMPTGAEVQLAERLVDAVPSLEKVRLVSSGTEAAMSAVRLARGVTGRNKVVKFDGHYHGHADALLVAAGSGVATLGIPGSAGVTTAAAADTLVAPFNDLAALDVLLGEHSGDLAAIICEPVAANMNLVPAQDGFLEGLRQRCTRLGAVLIFDEVITGFRLGREGAQGRLGVTPDLTVLGKAIGGGFPLAAFGGRAELMDQLAPLGPVYQAGTLSGNPVAVAAGIAQIDLLTDDAFVQIESATTTFVAGLRAAFAAAGVTATVTQEGTLAGIVFAAQAPRNHAQVQLADHAAYGRFFHAMLDRGVHLAPSGYEVLFTSVAHDESVLSRAVEAAAAAAAAM